MISVAHAQTAATAASSSGDVMQFLPMIVMFIALWFIMIRPQMKRSKEHRAMIDALQKGDEVVTQGGIVGKITKVGDAYIHIEIAQGTEVIVQKPAIGIVLAKGTIKTL